MNKINIIFITLFLLNFNSYAVNKAKNKTYKMNEYDKIIDVYIKNKHSYTVYNNEDAIIFDVLYKTDKNFDIKKFFIGEERHNQSAAGKTYIIDNEKVIFNKINPRKRVSDGSPILCSFKVWLINCGSDTFICFINTDGSIFMIVPKKDGNDPIYIQENQILIYNSSYIDSLIKQYSEIL